MKSFFAEAGCSIETLDIANTGVQRPGLRLIAAAIRKSLRVKHLIVDDNEVLCQQLMLTYADVCGRLLTYAV